MSRDPRSADPGPTAPAVPPRLRSMTMADFPAVHRLEARYLTRIFEPDDRRALFEQNPLWPSIGAWWPVGWVLEDADGDVVGSVTNVPTAYRYRGAGKVCATGLAWVAAPEYRAYAPLLMDEYFFQEGADLVLSSNVGTGASAVWQAYGTPVPTGDWSRAAYLITDRRAFARDILALKGVPAARALARPAAAVLAAIEALTARAVPRAPADVEIEEVGAFDDRFDAFWAELRDRHPDQLLAVRDRASLEWHYRVALRAGRLRVHTASRGGRLRAYCVVLRYDRPGGMRSGKIVDYRTVDPDADLLPGLVRAAADRSAAEGAAILEHNGCDVPSTSGFDRCASHRLTKAAWSFYFSTVDPALAADLARPSTWDPSEYDGDASYM